MVKERVIDLHGKLLQSSRSSSLLIKFSFNGKRRGSKSAKRASPERPSRFWALLPLALHAIEQLSGPMGGWEQRHPNGKRSKYEPIKAA